MRRVNFQNNEFYHIYNRGNDKREIFLDKYDYVRFIIGMREFNISEPIDSLYRLNQLKSKDAKFVATRSLYSDLVATNRLVDIVCYCLSKNHYHILIKQLTDNGVSKFMQKLGTGYVQYFNQKHNRSGSLFQGVYKAIHIQTDEYLQYLSAYINANAEIHKLDRAEKYPWSSYLDYLNKRDGNLCDKKIILDEFDSLDDYKEYVNIIISNASEIKEELKEYLLE